MNKTVTQPELWTGSFLKICLVNFFIFVNFHALLPTFPFFVTYLGGDAVAIGIATALFSIASIVSRPFVGWLVDTRGRCTILVVGLIGMALLPMGYFVAAGIAFAVVLRTIHGAFHAASSNAVSTWVTDIVPRSRMGEGIGMFGLSTALSTAAAPALGLAVMNTWGFQPLFALTTLAALVALLLGISVKKRDYKLSTEPLKWNELFEKLSVPASVTQFLFMIAYAVVEVYVAIYAASHHLPSGGIYFICIAVATVLTRLFLGRAIDKYGEAALVYTGNAALIVGILLLVFLHDVPAYILSALLLGYSFGAVQPSLQTMAMHVVSPERRGAANSTFFMAFDLGIGVGVFIAGVLIKRVGYDSMFLVMAVFGIIAVAYYFFFGRNHVSSFNPKNRVKPRDAASAKSAVAAAGQTRPLVITISREFGSGGHRIGEILAAKLGVPLYDKKLVSLTAIEIGYSEGTVEESEQSVDTHMMYDDPVQTKLFRTQTRIIREIARREPCIIVGRLSNFILEGEARCFNIFVYADKDFRIKRIAMEHKLTQPEAEALLQRNDRERSEHCLHYTGFRWGDRHHYDLLVNSSLLGA
ncbi:MAG: MFS transporter, partial [Prevotellaceae bacterium]|nr:MFS transporter [Prevotellaceae bacterium]